MADEKQASLGREIVAGLISIAILGVTVYMLIRTFGYGAQAFGDESTVAGHAMKDAYERQKDMLLYCLSLLGTVTGYYLGRVPAERAATRAYSEATAAKNKRNMIANAAQALVRKSEAVLGPKSNTLSGDTSTQPNAQSVHELEIAIEAVNQELVHY